MVILCPYCWGEMEDVGKCCCMWPSVSSVLSPRSGNAPEHWPVCGGRQAELCALPLPLPLRTQRGRLRQDEDHVGASAAAGVVGLLVPRAHARRRALRPDEPHDRPLRDRWPSPVYHHSPWHALFSWLVPDNKLSRGHLRRHELLHWYSCQVEIYNIMLS